MIQLLVNGGCLLRGQCNICGLASMASSVYWGILFRKSPSSNLMPSTYKTDGVQVGQGRSKVMSVRTSRFLNYAVYHLPKGQYIFRFAALDST